MPKGHGRNVKKAVEREASDCSCGKHPNNRATSGVFPSIFAADVAIMGISQTVFGKR